MAAFSIRDNPRKARRQAVALLRKGDVIIFPTDTVYGVGGDARKKKVVARIRRLKKRSAGKRFPWLVADLACAKRYVRFSSRALEIAGAVWPGAVTLVLPKRKGRGSLAIRIPDHVWLRSVLRDFGYPVLGTSANKSGWKAPRSARAAAHMLPGTDSVFDGGILRGRPSRILDLTVHPPRFLR